MTSFATQAGIDLLPADVLPLLSGYDSLTGPLSDLDFAVALLATTIFESELPSLRLTLGRDASVAEASMDGRYSWP